MKLRNTRQVSQKRTKEINKTKLRNNATNKMEIYKTIIIKYLQERYKKGIQHNCFLKKSVITPERVRAKSEIVFLDQSSQPRYCTF